MKNVTALVLALATVAAPAVASARGKVYGSKQGRPLSAPSKAAPADIAADFVRARGKSGLTMASVRATETPGQHNLTFVRMEQVVDGLRVHGAYARAAVNERGELVHMIDNLVPVTGTVKRADITERQALAAALRFLGHDAAAGAGYFHRPPTVERVIVQRNGGLAQGFLVETWSQDKNLLHHTLVGPDGAIDDVELRTNSDSYRIFAQSPEDSTQTVETNPADAVASPGGWLAGSQSTGLISGPNARAYLDADRRQNQPDNFGVAAGSDFLATWNPNEAANTTNNRTVAIQNLFYQNNRIHDTLYLAGFTPGEGNFEGNDPVQAEAQDGGGTDNANFATPADGSSPRMQMYLWTGGFQVRVNNVAIGPFFATAGGFAAKPTFTGETGDLAYRGDGCSVPAGVSGLVVLVDRGNCDFIAKAKNVASAGGRAVIVANNEPGEGVPLMGGNGKVKIEAVAVSNVAGLALKAALGNGAVNVTVRAADPPPGYRDGDLDADIIWHEYGHGLTWRMIGEMSGPFAGAIGEGMSDVNALIHGPDDRMAEYSASNPIGIRRAPYDTYPNTYGSMNTGTRQVHNDGEIYGAIGWRMIQAYETAGLTRSDLLADLVFGMTFTPSRPRMELMRDGILQGLEASNHGGRACLVWNAFAEYGVGVGASGTENSSTSVTVVESFDVPAECQ